LRFAGRAQAYDYVGRKVNGGIAALTAALPPAPSLSKQQAGAVGEGELTLLGSFGKKGRPNQPKAVGFVEMLQFRIEIHRI
jgi:hypothetical protein